LIIDREVSSLTWRVDRGGGENGEMGTGMEMEIGSISPDSSPAALI